MLQRTSLSQVTERHTAYQIRDMCFRYAGDKEQATKACIKGQQAEEPCAHSEEAFAVALSSVALLGGYKGHLCKLVPKYPGSHQKCIFASHCCFARHCVPH